MPVRPVRLFAAALLGACLATAAFAAGPSLVLRGDVATTRGMVQDIATAWAKGGHGKVQVQPFNTASGLDALRGGSADIAGSARPGNGSAQEAGLVFTPVAWDALVMITHPKNPVGSLSLKQLHDIYYGKITNWNQVGGRSEPMHVYAVASPGDGIEFSLRKLLFGRGNQPVAAPRLYVNTAKLEEAVTLDPKAIGVTTLSRVAGNRKVKMIRIDGTAPSMATVASGSYKLYTPLYLVTNPDSPHAAQAQAFVDFARGSQAASMVRRNDALPYDAGSALAAADASRRTQILAAVGARAVPQPATRSAPPVAAPGATYASRVATAPTSERTAEARRALEERKARTASLKGVSGEATTVAAARDPAFAKVTASATVKATAARPRTYKVARGDTLSSIARAHAVKVSDLRAWNHLKGNELKAGQVLHLGER